MQFFAFLSEKYNERVQLLIKKKDEGIKYVFKKRDANFISLGLFSPLLLSAYRFYLGDDYTIFSPVFGQLLLERIIENLTVLIFLPYLFFFLIAEKPFEFYNQIYDKIDYIFPIFLIFYRAIKFLCKNLFVGCMCVMCFYLLYLYCIFIGSSIHHLKTLLIPSTISLYFYLDESDKESYIFKNHPEFLPIREQLKDKHFKDNMESISQFCAIPILLFF